MTRSEDIETPEWLHGASLPEGPCYHGTRADLDPGDLLHPGHTPANFSGFKGQRLKNIYFTADHDEAEGYGNDSHADGDTKVYEVEPTGTYEHDPMQGPWRKGRDLRSQHPLRVVRRVTGAADALTTFFRTAASTDGYTTCDQGHDHWGTAGAAGLLLRHRGDDGHQRYLLQQRSPYVHHGGTWSIPGGALHEGEKPEEGARREAEEELDDLPDLTHHKTHTADHGGWAYHTVIADTPHQITPGRGRDGEADDHRWFTADEIHQLHDNGELHPGFAATWHQVRTARTHTDRPAAFGEEGIATQGLGRREFFAVGRSLTRTAADWFHGSGSRAPFSRFDFSKQRPDQEEEGGNKRWWNSRLGSHFSTEHDVAAEIAENNDGHIFHVNLDMKNPKHYRSEFDLAREGHTWARRNGYSGLTPGYAGPSGLEDALSEHPHSQQIADGFKKHLQSQGHDGITYGNEYEGPKGHVSAIAFHPDQINITNTHDTYAECEYQKKCSSCNSMLREHENECPECGESVQGGAHTVAADTAHRRQAAEEPGPKTYMWKGQTYGPEGYIDKEYEVQGPLYHGGGKRLREGDQLRPGRKTNPWGDEGAKSKYIHFTTNRETAAAYARQAGGHVFEVEPTGDFSVGYAGDEYKSEHPLNVTRKLDPSEWDDGPAHTDTTTSFFRQSSQPQEWHHGSGASFDRFDLSKNKTVQEDGEPKHWNSYLGAHFTSDHRVAQEFAQRQGGGHVYHARLDLKNPKHYDSEHELDQEAALWAHDNGHDMGPTVSNPAYRADIEPDEWQFLIKYDDENEPRPNAREIAHGFRDHLMAQGHDGITYGNEFEGEHNGFHAGERHLSAIAFQPDQIHIHQRHRGTEPCQHTASTTTSFFRQSATERYPDSTPAPEDGHGSADRAGDPAPRRDGPRPAHGQPERAARPLRHAQASGPVERHPDLQADLNSLGGGARHVQETIDTLHRGGSGLTTYALGHPLDGWHAAITGRGHQVVYRHDDDKNLHVGYAGHNITDAEKRLSTATGGTTALPVDFHTGAEKDFDKLHPDVQDKALETVDRLARQETHHNDHGWSQALKGWRSARVDYLHRITHRYEDADGNTVSPGDSNAARLFIGHIGPHNYEEAERRLAFTATEFLRHTAGVDDYRMQHGAPGPGEGNNHLGELGHAGEMVDIYRSAPHGIHHINQGDWVSTDSEYAHRHGYGYAPRDGDNPVLHARVPAEHVWTDHNDEYEQGYQGPDLHQPGFHHPDLGHITHEDAEIGEEDHKAQGIHLLSPEPAPEIHTGAAVHLSPEDHAYVHNPDHPIGERARRLYKAVRSSNAHLFNDDHHDPLDASFDADVDASDMPRDPHPPTHVVLHGHEGNGGLHHGISWAEGVGEDEYDPDYRHYTHHHLVDGTHLDDDSHPKTAAAEEPQGAEYYQNHRPADRDGTPLHDLTHNLPHDVYDNLHNFDPTQGDPEDHSFGEARSAIIKARGNPDAKIRIYRALPAEHAHHGFRPGDWVTTSKDYALQHARSQNNRGPEHHWPVIRTTVRAGDLHTDGDDLREWGYNGGQPKSGMVSFKGGYHQEVRHAADGSIKPVKRRKPKEAAQTADPGDTVRMVAPEEYRGFHFPDYPQAQTLPDLIQHFHKTSPGYYAKIRDDVQSNGFTTPILVQYKDQRGNPLNKPYVREGHHRAAVAHELGLHLPVGDYDNEADFQRSHQGNAAWFKHNERPAQGMPWHSAAADESVKGLDSEGHDVELDSIDGWHHADGSVSHDDGSVISDGKVRIVEAAVDASYRIDHAAPGRESGIPYHEHIGEKPDEYVDIYRAVPRKVQHINQGDWVSTHGDWTQERADSQPGMHVLRARVPSKHVYVDRRDKDDDEAGYQGPHLGEYDVQVHSPGQPRYDQERLFDRTSRREAQALQAIAEAKTFSRGVMIALYPPRQVAEEIALPDGQPVEDLHITLAYLGKTTDYTKEELAWLPELVGSWAARQRPVEVRLGGVGTFNNHEQDEHVLICHADIPGGAQLHSDLAAFLTGHGYKLPSEHGWSAHLTLAYVDQHHRFMPRVAPHAWRADRVVTVIGGQRTDAVLGPGPR